MNVKRVIAIFRKDMRAGIRNAQILVALLVPIGLGVLYNIALPDTTKLPAVSLVYSAPDTSRLPAALRAQTVKTVRLEISRVASPAAVRKQVDNGTANVGLVVPAGFDRALRQHTSPQITVMLRNGADTPARYVAASVEPAARLLAGGRSLLSVQTHVLPGAKPTMTQIGEEVGARHYGVLIALIMLIAMTSLFAVPLILTEEAEKKTLDALVMIASDGEVIAAKALVGLAYVAMAIPILLIMTGLSPEDMVRFGLGIGLLSVALVGFGLLLGGLFRTSAQVNTWSSFLLLPIVLAAAAVGYNLPRAADILIAMMPSSHAIQLATDGLTGKSLYGNSWVSVAVILAWGVAAYGLLWWRLQHREG